VKKVRNALSTLPWVEMDTFAADVGKQQVRFALKDKKSFDLDEVKEAIESATSFKVGKVLQRP
jgi:hypothetical protein